MYFDSHCHYDFADFDNDRRSIWQQCQVQGIRRLLIPGVSPPQWPLALAIARDYEGIVTAAGIHPWWVAQLPGQTLTTTIRDQLAASIQQPLCVAVGECGLDGLIDSELPPQQACFELHLQLATELALPLIIHVRKTHHQTLALLRRYQPTAGGVIHGFSGSLELAQAYWRLGFYLGIGGVITYERARKTRAVVTAMPLESLLLETDAPDMPLQGFQGQPNSPLQLPKIAQALAELRGESIDLVATTTTDNGLRLFNL